MSGYHDWQERRQLAQKARKDPAKLPYHVELDKLPEPIEVVEGTASDTWITRTFGKVLGK